MNRPHRNMFAFPAIALALLLLTACGQTVRTTPAHSTTIPHSGLQLAWHAGTTPGGGIITAPEGVVTVAPGDGDIAYMCIANGGSRVAIWVTHDRAAHWTHAATSRWLQAQISVIQPSMASSPIRWWWR